MALVQQYEESASRMLNNEEDVADAMQEAVLSAYEQLHTLKNDAYFNTWICKILINQCNSVLNKSKHYSTIDVDVLPEQRHDDFQNLEPEGTIKSRLSRGKMLLRNRYYKSEGVFAHEK